MGAASGRDQPDVQELAGKLQEGWLCTKSVSEGAGHCSCDCNFGVFCCSGAGALWEAVVCAVFSAVVEEGVPSACSAAELLEEPPEVASA